MMALQADDGMRKLLLRQRAYAVRDSQPNKDQASAQGIERILDLPEYQQAQVALWYLHCRSEFRTNQIVFQQIQGDKRIAVPYCTTGPHGEPILGLWRLRHQDELVSGSYGILEPPRDRWSDRAQAVDPLDLDIAIVPGVAFTRHGARLGNGKGYFDRLLQNVRPDCTLIGVCYESQLVEELPTSRHDVWMDLVVTEQNVYRNET